MKTMKNKQRNALLTLLLITLPSLGYSYDIDKAMEYASNHINDKSSSTYGYYGGVGGNCANYVSQILEHGGYEQKDAWIPRRVNWINANGIYSNLKNNQNGFYGRLVAKIEIKDNSMSTISGSLNSVKKGDIGFKMYDRPYKDERGMMHYSSHVFFISSAESPQNIKYMAHSPVVKNQLVRTNGDFSLKNNYKKRIVEFWRPYDNIIYFSTGNLEFNKLKSGFLTGKTYKDITKESKNKEYLDLFSDKTPKSTAKIYFIDENFEEDTEVKLSLFSKKNSSLRIDGKRYQNIKNPIVYIYHKEKNGNRVIDGKGTVHQNNDLTVSYLTATLKPNIKYFVEVTTDELESNVYYNLYMSDVNGESPDSSSNASSDDVYPSKLRLSSSRRGSKIKLRVRVNHRGDSTKKEIGTIYTSYYLSNSPTYDKNNATYLGYDRSSVGTDDRYDDESFYVKTSNLSKGKYYVHVVVDDKNGRSSLNESNERNNVQSVRLTTIR